MLIFMLKQKLQTKSKVQRLETWGNLTTNYLMPLKYTLTQKESTNLNNI